MAVAEPLGVVTTTSFASPIVPMGVNAVICVDVAITRDAATAPIFTLVVPMKLVPVMVMEVPPNVEPAFGLTKVIVGAST